MPYDDNYRLNVIGAKGKTQIFEGEQIKKLYETLSEYFCCNDSELARKNLMDEMYKRALERLTKK